MTRDEVMEWVADYERAWRDGDVGAVARLFTADAHYRVSPYEEPDVGTAAIGAFWLDDEDGRTFTMTAEPVAIDDTNAVVRVEVQYGGSSPQEYLDLWVLRFADDGRVAEFEEWAYWPGASYTAPPSTD